MSYQFALSLGDFDSGGELMVENRLGTKRYRVNTKNRIAKCADDRAIGYADMRVIAIGDFLSHKKSQKVTQN